MTPRLRPCDDPDCRICRWRDEEHQDSGHPEESLAVSALGVAAIVLIAIVFFVFLPVLT